MSKFTGTNFYDEAILYVNEKMTADEAYEDALDICKDNINDPNYDDINSVEDAEAYAEEVRKAVEKIYEEE